MNDIVTYIFKQINTELANDRCAWRQVRTNPTAGTFQYTSQQTGGFTLVLDGTINKPPTRITINLTVLNGAKQLASVKGKTLDISKITITSSNLGLIKFINQFDNQLSTAIKVSTSK